MSTQTATVKSKYVPVPIPINSPENRAKDALQSHVARRAFELYEQNGASHGEDLNNWLQAESEILTRVTEIEESSSWFTVNIPLKGYSGANIEVSVEPTHAIIAAKAQQNDAPESPSDSTTFPRSIFLLVKWPSPVDPATASAYFQNNALNLTAKRDTAAAAAQGNDHPNKE